MFSQEITNASSHVSHSLSLYWFMSVAYRQLLLGDRFFFSAFLWRYIHTHTHTHEQDVGCLQEQPTKKVTWNPVPLSKTWNIIKNRKTGLIMYSIHSRDEWSETGLNLIHRTVWGESLKFLWLFQNYQFIQINSYRSPFWTGRKQLVIN